MTWKTTEGGLREYLQHFDCEDLVCYHSFWDQCPRCDSLNTHQTSVRHPYTGVETERKCDNCGKEWGTKIYNSEWLEEEYGDEDDYADEDIDTAPICWACGQPMEWTGEEREIELEGGEMTVYEPIYECCNPDCDDSEDEYQ